MVERVIPQFTLGDRLRKARQHAGLEQTDLARELGISRKTVMRYEIDRTEPKIAVLQAWALKCGVPHEWLAFGIEPAAEAVIDTREQVISPTRWYDDRRPRRALPRRPEYAPVIRIGRAA